MARHPRQSTGTASYQHWRTAVLKHGQTNGVTNCPSCGVTLDYQHTRQPNSAEPDHITPVRWGGTNDVDNGQVLCRTCNISKGDGRSTQRVSRTQAVVTNLVDW